MSMDYPVNDGKEGALAMIKRGLDCLEGRHDLKPCSYGHWGIMACPHCGYIQPRKEMEADESHLRKTEDP